MRTRNVLLCTTFLFTAGLRPAAASDNFNVVDLGTLPGGSGSAANAINNAGDIAGFSLAGSGQAHAVLWRNHSGTMVDLHPEGFTSSSAAAINSEGQVVVLASSTAGVKTFLWSEGRGYVDISLPAGAVVFGINASGRLVGVWSSGAFFWTPQAGLHDLGSRYSIVLAVNNRGQMAGANGYHAILWSRTGDPQDLGVPAHEPPRATSTATAINQRGDVAGYVSYSGLAPSAPFLWTPTGGMLRLLTAGIPTGISVHREIVGYQDYAYFEIRAFYWTAQGGLQYLPDLQGSLQGSANAINDHIEIVGSARAPNGLFHAVLWTRK